MIASKPIIHHEELGDSLRKTPMLSLRPPRPSANSLSITGTPSSNTHTA